MRIIRPAVRAGTLAVLAFVLSSCDTRQPVAPEVRLLGDVLATPSLVECPRSQVDSATATILPIGGAVRLHGSSVVVPGAAIGVPTTIGIDEASAHYLILDLRANGQEHYQFAAPLTVTIDYSRCPADEIAEGPLSVWLVDPATGALLQQMPGAIDDPVARTITFSTDHFSGYAIAN